MRERLRQQNEEATGQGFFRLHGQAHSMRNGRFDLAYFFGVSIGGPPGPRS